MKQGNLFVISGPSGVGKTTIIKELLKIDANLKLAVSVTTRPRRQAEQEGVDYYFLKTHEFESLIKEESFLEWCVVYKNKYGTLKKEVEKALNAEQDIILDIDTQGTKKVKNQLKDITAIFIAPPSFKDLEERLKRRNTEEERVKKHRLLESKQEFLAMEQYDYVVVNEQVDKAVRQIKKIIEQKRK
jgi:guanylate kinase